MERTSSRCLRMDSEAQVDLMSQKFSGKSCLPPPRTFYKLSQRLKFTVNKCRNIDPDVVFDNSFSGVTQKRILYDKIFRKKNFIEQDLKPRKIRQFNYKDTFLQPVNRLKIDFTSYRLGRYLKPDSRINKSSNESLSCKSPVEFSTILVSRSLTMKGKTSGLSRIAEHSSKYSQLCKNSSKVNSPTSEKSLNSSSYLI